MALAKSGIYCIRCLANGRRYVGSSVNIANRWKSHRAALRNGTHPGKAMQASWLKHGEVAFEFFVLQIVDHPKDLVATEQWWIDEFNSANSRTGFNVSPTAGNCLGVRHTDETKAKHSARRKGVPKTEAHRKAIGDAHRGRTIPAERRARVAEGVRRYFVEHPEARDRMREVGRQNGLLTKGRKMSAKVRRQMSERRKNDRSFCLAATANLANMTSEQRAEGQRKAAIGRKGRPRRERRALTYAQAEKVRQLKAEGWTYAKLSQRFGLTRPCLCRIVKRRTYQRP